MTLRNTNHEAVFECRVTCHAEETRTRQLSEVSASAPAPYNMSDGESDGEIMAHTTGDSYRGTAKRKQQPWRGTKMARITPLHNMEHHNQHTSVAEYPSFPVAVLSTRSTGQTTHYLLPKSQSPLGQDVPAGAQFPMTRPTGIRMQTLKLSTKNGRCRT